MSIKDFIKRLRTNTVIKPIIVVKQSSELLEGHVALVTGGNSGIGFAIAKSLKDAGARVFIVGRDKAKTEKAAKEINAECITIDLSNLQEVQMTILKLYSDIEVDILVNSAGIHGTGEFLSITEDTFDQVISTNVKALYFISQYVANEMIKRKIKGHILNVSSASSLKPSWTPYEISKRAVNGITQGMAHKLIKYGIVVNGIAPGPTATPMLSKMMVDGVQWHANPSGRMSLPEEIASLAVFMVSGQGDSIVGDTFFITGGSGTICIDK